MPSVKELLSKIESGDISYEEKLAALSQVEASLQELKAKKEERVKFNVQLIIDEIKKVKQDVQVQLDYARSIVPERGPKGDQGERGVDGASGRNGVDGRDGRDGQDGKDGQDGVSVTGAKIDFDGSLIITLSTGREINVGEVVAADLAEKIRVTMSTNSTVAIQEEGSTITSGVRNINFTGAGVTATASGDSVTVDISGGGGGSPFTSPVEINVNSSSSALLINQIGAGNALLVEDSTNPDSTPTVIDQFGNLILGKTSRQSPIANKFEVHSTSSETSGSTPSVGLYNWSSSSSSAAHISFLRYPSGTVGTTTTPNASGDVLGRLRFYTQNGSGLFYSGGISATTASDLVSINMFYTGGSHTFNGPITSGTWNGTAIDIAYGGTGATTRQAAMDALAGAVTSGQYLRGDGTDVVMSAIQAADVPTLNQNTTGTAANVTGIVAVANGGSGTATPSLVAGTNVTITGTWPNQTVAASVSNRVVSYTDATSITINADTTDMAIMANTQAAGTFTLNAPTGTVVNGQKLLFRMTSTNVQTFSWNGVFRGSTDLALPTASSGAGKEDYLGFIYDSTSSKWDLIAKNFGF